MKTIAMASQRPFQKLNPLTLLAQLVSRQISGCLRVSNESASWSIYLEHGKLTYASNSVDPFKRLDRHLRRLNTQLATIESVAKIQMGLLFEVPLGKYAADNRDYQAICWLINQRYLNINQAIVLIEELAKEVIASFLLVKEGSVELIDKSKIDDFPKLCQLDLRTVIKSSHELIQRQQALKRTPTPPPQPPSQPASVSTQSSQSPSTSAQPPAQSFSAAAQSSSQLSSTLLQNGTGKKTETLKEPATEPKQTPTVESIGSTAKTSTGSSAKATYKIVCIDDSPAVLSAIKSFLDDDNFSVITISNPLSALMQIVRNKPDLILLDIGMPNLDGYELCSLLRRHPSFKETPIVMVTGNTGFVDRAKAKLVRASGYLTKPFTRSDLLKMIFKFLT